MARRAWLHFTLVELLVVIAIIGILMTLLLPSLQRAREMAKSIACIGNERQQGLAWQSYLADNNGWFPKYWVATVPSNVFWFNLFDSYDGGGKIWKCPSHDYPNWKKDYCSLSYGYNAGCYCSNTCTSPWGPMINMSSLKDLSGDILMCDSKREPDNWSCFVNPPGPSHPVTYLNPRHSNGMNLLWADGHATWTSYNEMLAKNPGTYNNPPPGWYGCQPWFRDPAYPNSF